MYLRKRSSVVAYFNLKVSSAIMMHMDKVIDMMDQMMRVDIFRPSEKHRMLSDDEKTFLNPNLIMDARHRILREDLSASPTKSSVLAEARRLLTQEETKELYAKKQQRFLERELKKFEMELCTARPKFSKPYSCRNRNLAPSDDEFWETSRKIRRKQMTSNSKMEKNSGSRDINIKNVRETADAEITDLNLEVGDKENPTKSECKIPGVGNIKVTIKDKQNYDSEAQRLCILNKCFDALKQNAKEERRLRDIKTKIQQNMASRITRKYFNIWKKCTESTKNSRECSEKEQEISEEQKIEMFIKAITEQQRELMRNRKLRTRNNNIVKEPYKEEAKRKSVYPRSAIIESPAQCRLNTQKQIIEKQRAKLIEQNKIIEELKLKEAQREICRSNKETVNMAKDTMAHCGPKTRRTLIQLMQQVGHRDESLTMPQRTSDPPKFLLRMEARAEARRKRVQQAEESRRWKLEEQKRKEEMARAEEEQTKRRLQQEAIAEARRLRREQEQNRLKEIERFRKLNRMADEFHRKYLLRRYGMEPLKALVVRKENNMKKARDRYSENLMKKIFEAWRNETTTQCLIKTEIADSLYNRNLMLRIFGEWKEITKESNLKVQVAIDFHDMKLLDKYFKLWQMITLEQKARNKEKEKIASSHRESKLKEKYFNTWKRYLTIVADIKESEKRKDELRQLVQKVIPNFDPQQRGVTLDD